MGCLTIIRPRYPAYTVLAACARSSKQPSSAAIIAETEG